MTTIEDMLDIQTLAVTPFQQNCRLVIDRDSSEALLIDPGGDVEEIISELERTALKPVAVLLTHSHLDHCGGVREFLEKYPVELYGHQAEREFRVNIAHQCQLFGIPSGYMNNCPEPDRYLVGGEELEFWGVKFKVLFTPGHSPGHLCFYIEEQGALIAGDTLFYGSIGRTDLPGGNHPQLINSIKTEILCLPDETVVMSGHGPDTTVGAEAKSNPFLQGA